MPKFLETLQELSILPVRLMILNHNNDNHTLPCKYLSVFTTCVSPFFFFLLDAAEVTACRKSNKLYPSCHHRVRTRMHGSKRVFLFVCLCVLFFCKEELTRVLGGGVGGGQAAPITLKTRPDPDGCLRCHLLFHLFFSPPATDFIEHVTDSDAHMAAAAAWSALAILKSADRLLLSAATIRSGGPLLRKHGGPCNPD